MLYSFRKRFIFVLCLLSFSPSGFSYPESRLERERNLNYLIRMRSQITERFSDTDSSGIDTDSSGIDTDSSGIDTESYTNKPTPSSPHQDNIHPNYYLLSIPIVAIPIFIVILFYPLYVSRFGAPQWRETAPISTADPFENSHNCIQH